MIKLDQPQTPSYQLRQIHRKAKQSVYVAVIDSPKPQGSFTSLVYTN